MCYNITCYRSETSGHHQYAVRRVSSKFLTTYRPLSSILTDVCRTSLREETSLTLHKLSNEFHRAAIHGSHITTMHIRSYKNEFSHLKYFMC